MTDVIRFFFKLVLCALLALAAGFVYVAVRTGDPVYTLYEWASPGIPAQQKQVAEQAASTKTHMAAPAAPALRVASLAEAKPTRIEDLLRATSD